MGLKINDSLSQSATIAFKFLTGEFSSCSGLLWLMMNLNLFKTFLKSNHFMETK